MVDAKSKTEAYTRTKSTKTQSYTVTKVGTRTQQVARYLADDLQELVNKAQIDLAGSLGIPENEYFTNPDQLSQLICDDIERMLREGLITGVHFLLSDNVMDKNTNAYNLRYHVEYSINIPKRSLSDDMLKPFGGPLDPPEAVGIDARFALLIDWNPQASPDEIKLVQRPRYFFDWVPVNDRYDANSVVRYRTGGLGTEVVRIESALPRIIEP